MNNIQEKRFAIMKRDKWVCQICGRRLSHPNAIPQLGHKINQSKVYIRKYGKEVIHHPLNLVATCCLKCNSAVSINGKHLLVEKLVEKIQKEIET